MFSRGKFGVTLLFDAFFSIHLRFKENNVIDKDLYNYNNTLEISDVAGLNGSFRCRVVNQFGSEFSQVAELKVMGKYSSSVTRQICNTKMMQLVITAFVATNRFRSFPCV